MKTRMFVAEIFWLFLGFYVCPQSPAQNHDIKQRDFQPTFDEQDNFLKRWYSSALNRPPPPDP